ncbi:MAG: protein kinase, partial [Kiritimatiellae bacterium]|nr:protein kinase [Kiritimatiellia bacterium]
CFLFQIYAILTSMKQDEIEKWGFRLEDKLGETQFTEVYRAVQLSLNRPVQVQILKADLASDASVVRYFLGIARLLARVKNPYVISIFDIISDTSRPCVIMESLDGMTAREYIRQNGLFTRKDGLRIAVSIANGIAQLWDTLHLVIGTISLDSICIAASGDCKITELFQFEQADKDDGLATYTDMRKFGSLVEQLLSDETAPLPDDIRQIVNRLCSVDPAACFTSWQEVQQTLRQLSVSNPEPTGPVSKIRLHRKEAVVPEAKEFQDKSLISENNQQIHRENLRTQLYLWAALCVWFALLFWLRAFHSTKQVRSMATSLTANVRDTFGIAISSPDEGTSTVAKPQSSDDTDDTHLEDETKESVSAAQVSTSADADPSATEKTQGGTGIPTSVQQAWAKALRTNGIAGLKKAISETSEDFSEKATLAAFMASLPDWQTLVQEGLESKIGKQLVIPFKGQKHEVTLRTVSHEKIHFEYNGRGSEIPLSQFAPDLLLSWMKRPSNAKEALVWCSLLIRSDRADEVPTLAAKCPLLQSVILAACEE